MVSVPPSSPPVPGWNRPAQSRPPSARIPVRIASALEVAVLRGLRVGHLLRLCRQRSGVTRLQGDGERQGRLCRCWVLLVWLRGEPGPGGRAASRRPCRRRRHSTRSRPLNAAPNVAAKDRTTASQSMHETTWCSRPSRRRSTFICAAPYRCPQACKGQRSPPGPFAAPRGLFAHAPRTGICLSLPFAAPTLSAPEVPGLSWGQPRQSPDPDPVDGRRGGKRGRRWDEVVRPDPRGPGSGRCRTARLKGAGLASGEAAFQRLQ